MKVHLYNWGWGIRCLGEKGNAGQGICLVRFPWPWGKSEIYFTLITPHWLVQGKKAEGRWYISEHIKTFI